MRPQPDTGTLARGLLVVLAAEAFFLVLIPGAVWLGGAISGQTWALLAGGWYFGFRAAAVGKNFLQTWQARSPRAPEHQIGALATLRLLWGEYYATLVVYSFLFPFEAWLVPQAPKPVCAGSGMPIVLVPGFACNRGYWLSFAKWLSAAGQGPVYAVSLEPLFGSIDENARRLGERVEAICAATRSQRVILIGHSMGGGVARAWLHAGGAARIERIIALGSPHRGTVLTKGIEFLGENLRQMSVGSAWTQALNAHEQRPCPVPITAIVTPHDSIVAPQDSCYLRYPNARNITLPGIGHLEMVLSRPVFEATLRELQA